MTIDLTFLQTHGEMILAMIAVIFVMALFWGLAGKADRNAGRQMENSNGTFLFLVGLFIAVCVAGYFSV